MKTAAREVLQASARATAAGALLAALCAWLIAAAPVSSGADANARELLAHGTDQRYWAANVAPVPRSRTPAVKTSIRYRAAGDAEWREIAEFATPAVALADRGAELLLVLSGGQWSIVSDDGSVRSGTALPGGAGVMELASDGDDVWAVAAAPKGKMIPSPATTTIAATTTPTSTNASAATTSAATSSQGATTSTAPAPAATRSAPQLPPHDVGLFRLHLGRWSEEDVLPAGVGRDDIRAISMAVVDHRLMVALAAGLEVRVYTHDERGGWDAGTQVAVLGDRGEIKLLNHGDRPLLWMSDPAGPGVIFTRGDQRWSGPVKLEASPKLAGYDRRTLVVALGRLRLLASNPAGQLAEQFYKLDGFLDGPATEAVTIPRVADERLQQFFQVLVVVVLLVWMIGSMQHRPAIRVAVERIDQLQLAPLKRRAIGGVIDLVPLALAFMVADRLLGGSSPPTSARLTLDSPALAALGAGVGTYLLLTTLLELVLGRSIGKLLTGTRVAALDARPAPPAAVLIRNLLRIVDLMLVFPLGFVIFSPLRQRVGDMAAGTIVVMNDAPALPPAPPPPPDES
jgi:uncharacterized RDD family membrane protein YckC